MFLFLTNSVFKSYCIAIARKCSFYLELNFKGFYEQINKYPNEYFKFKITIIKISLNLLHFAQKS